MPLRAPRGFIAEDDPKVAPIGHPAPPWLINYADLMTEMVAFFVIMYALGAAMNKDVQKAKKEVEEMMRQEQIEGKVEVSKDGLRITMQEGGTTEDPGGPFFESAKAELTPRMAAILDHLSPKLLELAKKNHEVLVEGHTDDVPIMTPQFASNWELSTARATVVVRYLIDSTQFPPDKIGATGYGQFRPVVPNDSNENRVKNRRVVFFVRNPPSQKFTPASGAKADAPAETAEAAH